MDERLLKSLEILAAKEEALAGIIIWLKTKGLYEECMSVVAPHLIEKSKPNT